MTTYTTPSVILDAAQQIQGTVLATIGSVLPLAVGILVVFAGWRIARGFLHA